LEPEAAKIFRLLIFDSVGEDDGGGAVEAVP